MKCILHTFYTFSKSLLPYYIDFLIFFCKCTRELFKSTFQQCDFYNKLFEMFGELTSRNSWEKFHILEAHVREVTQGKSYWLLIMFLTNYNLLYFLYQSQYH